MPFHRSGDPAPIRRTCALCVAPVLKELTRDGVTEVPPGLKIFSDGLRLSGPVKVAIGNRELHALLFSLFADSETPVTILLLP